MDDILKIVANFNGVVRYNVLQGIFDATNFVEQLCELREDLFLAEFPNGFLLDIGWYPSFDARGAFKIFMIKNGDWCDVAFSVRCKKLEKLNLAVKFACSRVFC